MNEEIKSLVNAIESLQQDSNPFKDYVFPIITGFFSSILGAFVAYFTLRHQDRNKLEKERINTINDWLLLAEGAMSSLIAIKSNYHGKLSSDPIQRTLAVPALIHRTLMLEKNISTLSFIIPPINEIEAQKVKWRQLPRIRAMINNYNFIIELWNKRNKLERPLKEKIINDYADFAHVDISREQIFKSVKPADFIVLIDLTEKAIKFTDDLIVEFDDFMSKFTEIGKSIINKKYVDKYGPLISFSTKDNHCLLSLIKKSPEVDYKILSELFGKAVEDLKIEYSTGYE